MTNRVGVTNRAATNPRLNAAQLTDFQRQDAGRVGWWGGAGKQPFVVVSLTLDYFAS